MAIVIPICASKPNYFEILLIVIKANHGDIRGQKPFLTPGYVFV